MSNFPGYGAPVTVVSKNIALHPLDAKRWEAARVVDKRRQDWYV